MRNRIPRAYMLVIPLALLAVVAFSGCLSSESSYNPPALYKITAEHIREDALGGRIAQAVQDHRLLSNRNEVPEEELEELWTIILDQWEKSFREAIDGKEYDRAISLAVTASQADFAENVTPSFSLGELRADYVLSLAAKDTPVPAFAALRELESLDLLSSEELELLRELAGEEYKRTVAAALTEELESRAGEESPDTVPDKTYSHAELISSTVTIWVNRGMKIEGGVGLPDRVIGSGFYIDKRGYILTNYHVIRSEVDPTYEGYSRLYVRPSENTKQKIPARVVGWDPAFDIALLKVEREVDSVLSFSPNLDQQPGERIYAIGSPAGLENTITSGIVSATGRRFLEMGDVVQVDVPINQGNSGGPLLDESGHLIGVVYAGIEQFEGVNFAIPAKWVLKVLDDLYEGKQVGHSFLGAALERVNGRLEVSYIYPGGPADKIGLRPGDTLTAIAGEEVDTVVEAQEVILGYGAGTLLRIDWIEGETQKRGYAALNTRPSIPMMEAIERDRYENLFAPLFGMQVDKTVDSLLKTRYSVKKVYQGSIADDVGLSVNDPFSVQKWSVLEDKKVVLANIRIKKRKAGFLETGVQLGAYLEINNMI